MCFIILNHETIFEFEISIIMKLPCIMDFRAAIRDTTITRFHTRWLNIQINGTSRVIRVRRWNTYH